MSIATQANRPWFQALESLGEFFKIRYGFMAHENAPVEWHFLPHTEFDGIGGLASILRDRGAQIKDLPQITHDGAPSWQSLIHWLPKMLSPRKRLQFSGLNQGEPVAGANIPAPASASHLFSKAETLGIRHISRKKGVSVNSYLLHYLNRAVRPSLVEPSSPIPWMVPVNLRGRVKHFVDTGDHSSYVTIKINRADSPLDVHRSIYDRLDFGEHWANWKTSASAGSILPLKAKQKLLQSDCGINQWTVGSFSNIGIWDPEEKLTGHSANGYWFFAPPVLRSQQLGVGCVTFRGRLSLLLQVHPDLTMDSAVPQKWTTAWVNHILHDLPKLNVSHSRLSSETAC